MNIPQNDFGLTKDKLLLLYFYAYMADDGIEKSLSAFCREFAYKENAVTAWTTELVRCGLIKYYYLGWNHDLEINYYRFLPVAAQMLAHEKELLGVFDRMHLKRNDTTLAMWQFAACYVADDTAGIMKLFRSGKLEEGDWEELLKGKLHEPLFKELFLALDHESFEYLLDNALTVDMYNQDASHFSQYAELMAARGSDPFRVEMLDRVNALDYLANGKPFKPAGVTVYSVAVQAVKALYARNIALAEELFTQSLKIRNKTEKIKNVYDDPIFNFFLALCWKMADTPESRKKMEQFCRKETASSKEGIVARAIIYYLNTDNDRRFLESAIGDVFRKTNRSLLGYRLADLLARHFDVQWHEKRGEKVMLLPPEWAFLRYELSPYVRAEDAASLAAFFGGEPLLAGIKEKESWEITIEDMMAKLRKGTLSGDATPQKAMRIGYFVRYSDVEIHQQKRLKTGAWGAGAAVSISRFRAGDVEGMDDIDRSIAKRVSGYYSSRVERDEVLPFLIGSDKVYVGRCAPFIQAVVEEEKTFLAVKRGKEGFSFSSNISGGDRKGGSLVRQEGKDGERFVVVNYSSTQLELVEMLCRGNVFPAESAEALKKLLQQLSSVLEIHSDLLEGGSSLENASPDNRLFLRVTPQRDSFAMSIYVRPLKGGSKTFFPGEGERIVFDSADGTRYQVTRSFREEQACLNMLEAVLEGNGTENVTLSTEQMLDVLDFAAGREDLVLEWPEGKSLKLKGSMGAVSIEVTSGEHWFDMEGEVKVGEDSVAIARILEILAHSRMTGRYLPLGEGQYVKLSESLKKSLQQLESLSTVSRGKSRISIFQAGAFSELLQSGLSVQTDGEFRETLSRIESAAASVPPVPKGLKAELRDYQVEGFRFLSRLAAWGGGACLADDMGLGKTVQALALMLSRAKEGPSLVVAPASVVLNWRAEMERFAPGLRPHVLGSTSLKISALKAGDVLLASYGMLVTRQEAIEAVKWNIACLDEAHTIKNRSTKMSSAAMSLDAKARVILTGTPIQNHLGELWNLMQFLLPGMLGSYEQFSQRYITPIEKYSDRTRQSALKKLIQPFLLRRTKADVLDDLPEKTDIIRLVPLAGEEMAAYENLRQSAQEALAEQESMDVSALAMITKLRMAACGQSKADYFVDMASEIVAAGNRALVFSQFTSYLKTVSEALDAAGIPYLYLDGDTPVRKRNALVKEYQEGEVPLFLISLKAGGLGLNLTGANYVIHLDPWWNPAIEQQATDRAYRIGQTKDVTVYHLISAHTIEEKILRLHRVKRNLADSLLEGTHMASALTLADLRALAESALA